MQVGRRFGALVVALAAACAEPAPSLSTTEQALISVTPGSGDFGSVALGSSVTMNFQIYPDSLSTSNDDTITKITTSCSQFTVYAPNLPARVHCGGYTTTATGKPGGSCLPITYEFGVTFAPTLQGLQTCSLTIAHASTNNPSASSITTIGLSGTGVASTFAMAVSRTSVVFGDIPSNSTSGSETIAVQNVGTSPIHVSINVSGTPFALVSIAPSGPLQPGAEMSHQVSCVQPPIGTHAGSITFTLAEDGATQTVALSCNGITSSVAVTPRPVVFPSMLVGAVAVNQLVTIANSVGTTVTLTSVALAPSSSPDLSIVDAPDPGITIGSGENVTLTLRYLGATPRESGALGALDLVVDGQPQSIAISGEALVATIGTTPAALDFGPICVGRPALREVDVYASDRGRVQVSSVTPPGAIFAATDLSAELLPLRGNEETVVVTAMPSTPGEFADSFVINSNAPGDTAHEVPVSATVLVPGVLPTPTVVTFGVAIVGTTSLAQKLAVTNCSDAPVNIASASIRSQAPGEFAAVSDPVATLQPGESHELLVVMTPAANGARTAELTIDIEGGAPILVPLEGEGYGLAPIERETYYACAATRTTALWPVLLVLGLVCRRRRRT